MPRFDVGLAIILITLLIKLVLAPMTKKAIISQIKMKELEPEMNKIKAEIKDNALQQKAIFALYKEKKVSPFSACMPMIVQILVLGSLYFIFRHGFAVLPSVAYSFVHSNFTPNVLFLTLIDITKPGIILALISGITQYIAGYIMKSRQGSAGGEGMAAQINQSMQNSMLYFLPVMITLIAYSSGVVALYFITSNIFTIGQEIYIKRHPLV